MKLIHALLALLLALAAGASTVALEPDCRGAQAPAPSPRAEALMAIEADRDAVVESLAARVPERDRESARAALRQLENHELIDRMVAGDAALPESFGAEGDYADLVYTALETPCRILDTRKYTYWNDSVPGWDIPTPFPITGRLARAVWDNWVGDQGGGYCAVPLYGKPALVVGLAAISPTFPNKFPGQGFATLLNGDEAVTDWTLGSFTYDIPNYAYNGPGNYNKAASIVFDQDTRLIETLATVSVGQEYPHVILYSSGDAHFTIDVVGYLDKPRLCPEDTTFIDGQCWGPEQSGSWYEAIADCSSEGGRLPTAADVIAAGDDLYIDYLWGAGWYSDDGVLYAQLQGPTTGYNLYGQPPDETHWYRCVFTPLTQP